MTKRKAYNRRRVRRDDGVVFPSITDAAESVSGKVVNIIAVCAGRAITAYGHKWKYVDAVVRPRRALTEEDARRLCEELDAVERGEDGAQNPWTTR